MLINLLRVSAHSSEHAIRSISVTSGKVLQGDPLGGEIESVGQAQLCQTPRRMNGYFGNLTFLPEKKLLQNFKLFKKSFPSARDEDFAYSALRHFLKGFLGFCSHLA